MIKNNIYTQIGLIAISFAIIGIFIVPPLFILFSIIIAIIGILFSFDAKNKVGIILSSLGLLLSIYAFWTSPIMFELFGIHPYYLLPQKWRIIS